MQLSASRLSAGRASASGPSLESLALAAIRRNNGSLWGVPASNAGLFTDSGGTTPATAVGDVLGRVNDRVGSNHATQPATANKPVIASLPNGRRAMKFDGSNDLLNLGPGAVLSNASDHWVCAAVRFSDVTGGIRAIYTCSNPSSLAPLVCDVELNSVGRLQAYWRDDAGGVAVLQGQTAVVNTPYVITACKIGANRFLWVNGISQGQTAVNPGLTSTTVATIGALIRTSTQYYLPGDVAVSVGQSSLSDPDRSTIERYLAQQIGAQYLG